MQIKAPAGRQWGFWWMVNKMAAGAAGLLQLSLLLLWMFVWAEAEEALRGERSGSSGRTSCHGSDKHFEGFVYDVKR